MKKLIAGLVAIMILVCGCTAAFADQKSLTREEAIQVALDRVGLKDAGVEYDFDIDARTGNVLEMDISRRHGHDTDWDDWDDIFDFD